MTLRFVGICLSLCLAGQFMPAALAATQPDLNFKIYSPPENSQSATDSAPTTNSDAPASDAPAKADDKTLDSLWSTEPAKTDSTPAETPAPTPETSTDSSATSTPASDAATPAADASSSAAPTEPVGSSDPSVVTPQDNKVLKGYIRVVPSGTKVPIIMDTAIDTDTSQEGDEFTARTSEDLNIDGSTVVPAGSVIKGRIAQLNNPKSMCRSGSVALKFDTVTTPDNRQLPLVANLVARGGVVHARRGVKDIAMNTGTVALPTLLGIGIGALAGSATNNSNGGGGSHINGGQGALIGAGVGVAVGVAILLIKKGKKVDVRPGDELKIELAEDLRMPM